MTKHNWTCGHVAPAVCMTCHTLLAQRANELAEELMQLQEAMAPEPVLSTVQQIAFTTAVAGLLPAEEIFRLGWRAAMRHAREQSRKKINDHQRMGDIRSS